MQNLRSKLIRLAHQKPELRPQLLPLLASGHSKRAWGLSHNAYLGMNKAVGDLEDEFQALRSKAKDAHVKRKIDLALKALQDVTNCLDYLFEEEEDVERGL
jgi:hypothetical protein